jgi:solute carrier family 25 protein 33/36
MREVPAEGSPRKYVTLLQSFGRVWAEEGAAGLYGGMAAHMVRVVPNACIMFITYELFVRALALQ